VTTPGFKAPYFSYHDIRRRAEVFLQEHHPSATVPIPIEEIVEFQFGIDIVPTPGLHNVIEMDGFITSDLRVIHVEEFVWRNRVGRYRFTLAHELGHAVLHRDVYEECDFQTVAEWKQFINTIPDQEHRWLEWHAYAFAGLVLVPSGPLVDRTGQCLNKIRSEGIDIAANREFVSTYIAAFLAKEFEVSAQVVEKRLLKEGIVDALSRP
jgi:Zn-dependent peptidase ImmA (M78 family)